MSGEKSSIGYPLSPFSHGKKHLVFQEPHLRPSISLLDLKITYCKLEKKNKKSIPHINMGVTEHSYLR